MGRKSKKVLKEIQDEEPEIPLSIDKVGVRGVRRRIVTQSPKGPLFFDVVLDAYVDLPANRRGIHMSRNIEAFIEAIDQARVKGAPLIENVLEDACLILLEKHPYASKAEIKANTTFFYNEDFAGISSEEAANVSIVVIVDKNGSRHYSISVSVYGMTVCPSAQETYHQIEGTPLHKSPSHSQRAKLTLTVSTKGFFVRIEDLIDAARLAFSAPATSLLKREDEHLLVKKAFEKPRLVEDLVRYALHNVYHILRSNNCPEDTLISVEAESFESIHIHNAYASRTVTLEAVSYTHLTLPTTERV